MPWTNNDYPDSFKNFTKEVREKAIDIANTLLDDEHMEEGKAIAIATSRAKDWAANHDKPTKKKNTDSKDTDVQKDGRHFYVTPHEDGWAVKVEGNEERKVYDTKEKAIAHAREEAKSANASLIIQGQDGKIQDKYSYNPNSPGRG